MAITRKQALKRIEGLIGDDSPHGIEAHFTKLDRRGSGSHIRHELEARLAEIERLASHVGRKTQGRLSERIAAWRDRLEETEDVQW